MKEISLDELKQNAIKRLLPSLENHLLVSFSYHFYCDNLQSKTLREYWDIFFDCTDAAIRSSDNISETRNTFCNNGKMGYNKWIKDITAIQEYCRNNFGEKILPPIPFDPHDALLPPNWPFALVSSKMRRLSGPYQICNSLSSSPTFYFISFLENKRASKSTTLVEKLTSFLTASDYISLLVKQDTHSTYSTFGRYDLTSSPPPTLDLRMAVDSPGPPPARRAYIRKPDEKDPKVLLDGRPTISTFQREQILKAANEHACAIDFDSIRGLKGKIKEFTSGKQVIYIYHNRIDSTGESMRTENSVFDATVKSIEELFSLVSWLSKSGNVYRFLITADHGFIYTRKKLAATDKLENAAGKSSFTDRRFIISKEKYDTEGIYAMSLGEILGNSDSRSIMLAKGMSVFKCGGGMNYVHGGASPQEMIVPSIFIRTQKGIVKVEDVKLNLITDIRKITNLRLKLDFYQEQAVSDVIKAAVYRIRFEADDGEIVSNEVIYSADSKDEKPGNRIVTLGFDIKKKSYGNEHKYYLKILKDSKTEMFEEAMSRQVIMDLPFTEDFGFDV